MKMTIFWDVEPCRLVDFTDVSEVLTTSIIRATIIRSLMMEVVRTSETSVNFYQTTRCNITEDSYLQL
jgi:hypothetical protein